MVVRSDDRRHTKKWQPRTHPASAEAEPKYWRQLEWTCSDGVKRRKSRLAAVSQSFAPGQDIPTLAVYWRRLIQDARETGRLCRAYMEVRYEALVRDPSTVLHSICNFLELDFDSAMLRYWERTAERLREHKSCSRSDGRPAVTHEQRLWQQRLTLQTPQADRIFDWKNTITPGERNQFLHFAGDMLEELGYET